MEGYHMILIERRGKKARSVFGLFFEYHTRLKRKRLVFQFKLQSVSVVAIENQ